jgi:hypothetical protein
MTDIGLTDITPVDDGETAGPGRLVRLAVLAMVLLPFITSVARALRHHWFPIGDDALLYIRVRDVVTDHHPLLGSWTSASLSVGENMNNPGPIYQDLVAPFAHAFSPGPGAAIGAAAVNIAAIVGISSVSRRVGGWSAQRWFLLACAALSWTMGSELLYDIWQAHALMLTFLCYLVLLIAVAEAKSWSVPASLGVASLLVQTHISYAYILVLLTPVAIALAWWQHRPLQRSDVVAAMRSRMALISGAVVAVVWAQPIIEQLFGEGRGNLLRLATNSGGGDVTVGFGNAAKIVAGVVALPPWWLRRGFSTTVPSTRFTDTADGQVLVVPGLPGAAITVIAMLVLVGGLVLLAIGCRRIGQRAASNACVLAAAGSVMAVVCVGLLTVGVVGLAAHHVRWVWTLAVFVHVVAAWAAVTLVQHRWHSATLRRLIDPVIVVAIAVFSLANIPFYAQKQGPVSDVAAMPALREVFTQLEPLAADDPILFRTDNVRVFEPYSATVMMRLQELGIEFRVTDEGMVRQLGNGRRADGSETTTVFQLERTAALVYDGPGCLVAEGNALNDADEALARDAAERLAAGLVNGTIDVVGVPEEVQPTVDAALSGDLQAARTLVYDGYLAAWTTDAIADISGIEVPPAFGSWDAAFAAIDRWVFSTYALFAESPVVCS